MYSDVDTTDPCIVRAQRSTVLGLLVSEGKAEPKQISLSGDSLDPSVQQLSPNIRCVDYVRTTLGIRELVARVVQRPTHREPQHARAGFLASLPTAA